MSLSNPIGINSDVLNIKAAQVSPNNGSQFLNDILVSINQCLSKFLLLWMTSCEVSIYFHIRFPHAAAYDRERGVYHKCCLRQQGEALDYSDKYVFSPKWL